MFCHVAKSHNNKLSIKKLFPFQFLVNLVCLSTRDRSYNCDSLLKQVYHYLIEYPLKYVTHVVIQIRMSSPKAHLVLTSSIRIAGYFCWFVVLVFPSLWLCSLLILNAVCHFWIMCFLISSNPHYTARWISFAERCCH